LNGSSGERPTFYRDGEQALLNVYVYDCVEALARITAPEADRLTVNVTVTRKLKETLNVQPDLLRLRMPITPEQRGSQE
jgi:hypothetical protein